MATIKRASISCRKSSRSRCMSRRKSPKGVKYRKGIHGYRLEGTKRRELWRKQKVQERAKFHEFSLNVGRKPHALSA